MATWDWSKTAASNTTVEGNTAAEGMTAAGVNNLIRAIVAALAEWRDDIGCQPTTGGSANAQTLTTNGGLTALADGVLVGFTAGFTNTGATTLNVDSLGAQDVRKYTSAGLVALTGSEIMVGGKYLLAYEATGADWILLNPSVGGYQEGTCTPALTFGGASTGITYSGTNTAKYIKIGKNVHVQGALALTSKGSSTGVAQFSLTGAPTSDGTVSSGEIGFFVDLAALTGAPMIGINLAVAEKLSLTQSAAANPSILLDTSFTNTSAIYFSITYTAAS